MFEVSLLIDNHDREATGGATFDRLNPLTGEVASRAAEAAASAVPAWSQTPPTALLNKAADLLESRTAEFAALMGAETGASAMWDGFNCTLGQACCAKGRQ